MNFFPVNENRKAYVDLTMRLAKAELLPVVRSIKGLTISKVLQGKREESFTHEVYASVHTRTALGTIAEMGGIVIKGASLAVPLKPGKRSMWGDEHWWISLKDTESALNGETQLTELRAGNRISSEDFDNAQWMFHRVIRLLRKA